MQPRRNLEVLLVHKLAILRDLGALNLALLLHLTQTDPFLHPRGSQVLADLGKGILSLAEALEERAIVDGVKEDVVVGSDGGRERERWG